MTATKGDEPAGPFRRKSGAKRLPRNDGIRAGNLADKILTRMTLSSGETVLVLRARKFPEGDITEDAALAEQLRRHFEPEVAAVSEPPVISARAFEPDARARAILRGVTYAQQDLEESGGAYDLDQVRTLLHGVSRQAIDKRVADGSLLAVPGPSGHRRFPTVQFNEDGGLIAGLKEIRAAIGSESRWSVLNFLINPHDLLGRERPVDVLRRGEVDRVVRAANLSGVQGA